MKIDLKISNDAFIACNNLLKEIYNSSVPITEVGKLVKSIGFEVADKIDSKCKGLAKKVTLFDKKKPKLTLQYYQAWGLYQLLVSLNEHNANEYSRGLVQNVIHILNQKLT